MSWSGPKGENAMTLRADMTRRASSPLLVAGVLVAVLAGCGSTELDEAGGFGTYEVAVDGTRYQVEIPAPDNNELIATVEAILRPSVDLVYILVAVDNTGGNVERRIFGVSVVTEDGKTVEASFISNRVADALNELDGFPVRYYHVDAVPREVETAYAEGLAVFDATSQHRALPGAKFTTLMTVKAFPSVKSVFVDTGHLFEPAFQLRKPDR